MSWAPAAAGHGWTLLVAVLEAVGDGLGNAGHTDGHAIHNVLLDVLGERRTGETHAAQRRIGFPKKIFFKCTLAHGASRTEVG